MHINYEFKAKVDNSSELEATLANHSPLFTGEDHQVDTYFNVPYGRLKLREGNIENALIHYERINSAGAKQSNVLLYQHQSDPSLKQILIAALGVKAIVDKKRKIYFIGNVKFHFDTVQELGTFVEVEAIDKDGSVGLETLKHQCAEYSTLFGLEESQFIAESYSDMVLAKKSSTV
jgi:predicted adenylyl cyclase CyaB